MADFSFGQVEVILGELHSIMSHKRSAFTSRLKHLQKNGVPIRDRPGRGRSGSFNFDQLMQIAAGVELLQAGLPPQLASQVVVQNWSKTMQDAVAIATIDMQRVLEARQLDRAHSEDFPGSWLWFVRVEALEELMVGDQVDRSHDVVTVPLEEIAHHMRFQESTGSLDAGWRSLFVNATFLTRTIVGLIVHRYKFCSIDDLVIDFPRVEKSEIIEHDLEVVRTEGDLQVIRAGNGLLIDFINIEADEEKQVMTESGRLTFSARALLITLDQDHLEWLRKLRDTECVLSSLPEGVFYDFYLDRIVDFSQPGGRLTPYGRIVLNELTYAEEMTRVG